MLGTNHFQSWSERNEELHQAGDDFPKRQFGYGNVKLTHLE
jgi:hypothetical protein